MYEIFTIGTDTNPLAVGKHFCDHFEVIPSFSDTKQYLDSLISISSRYKINDVIPDAYNPSYTSVDAGIYLSSPDQGWKLALVGRNLSDEYIQTRGTDAPSTGGGTGTARSEGISRAAGCGGMHRCRPDAALLLRDSSALWETACEWCFPYDLTCTETDDCLRRSSA